jgi:hypothetical protein
MHGISCANTREAHGARRLKTIAALSVATVLVGCNQQPGSVRTQYTAEKVHLIWKQATNEWKLKLNNGHEQNPASAKTTLAEDTGPTMFVVDIQNSAPATFKASGSLSVWHDSKAPGNEGSTQILGPIVTPDGKRLFFIDLNQGNAVTLYYGLKFNEAGIPSVDPIIDNGGGD